MSSKNRRLFCAGVTVFATRCRLGRACGWRSSSASRARVKAKSFSENARLKCTFRCVRRISHVGSPGASTSCLRLRADLRCLFLAWLGKRDRMGVLRGRALCLPKFESSIEPLEACRGHGSRMLVYLRRCTHCCCCFRLSLAWNFASWGVTDEAAQRVLQSPTV